MKTNSLRKIALCAMITTAAYANAQWNPLWYPGGFTPGANGDSYPIIPDATPWALGGNMLPFQVNVNGHNNYSAGTCDGNTPFALKSNGTECIFMSTAQEIGIGANHQPLPGCVLDIRGNIWNNQSNLRIYGNADGDIESTSHMKLYHGLGRTFELRQGGPGSSNLRMSVDAVGLVKVYHKLDVGANMFVGTGARVGVDGQTSPGVVVIGNNGHQALHVANSAGASRFRFWVNAGGNDDSKCHIAGSTQIGFHLAPGGLVDNNTRLNVDAYGGTLNGVKVTTNNNNMTAFFTDNNNARTFEVKGDGRTHIGSGRPHATGVAATAMLSVDGMVLARDVRVAIAQGTHWADYVFEADFKRTSLQEVKEFVARNKHLPGIPSEAEVKDQGLDVVDMNIRLLQKIEELYLHSIDMNERLDMIAKENAELKATVTQLLTK
jgi:hypothetical protein